MTFKRIVNRLIRFLFKNGKLSYSQGGEDMILNIIFLSQKKGFYVDIGANHPTKYSNTYFYYKKGWSGINIDALSDAIKLFRKQRKRDININTGVGDKEGILKFHMFKESCYNTFNENLVSEIIKVSNLISVQEIKIQTLASILNQQKITNIDFMSIDVEGFEINVLKSNDWNLFRPKVILIEDFNYGNEINNSETYNYLLALDYVYLCRTVTNVFYLEKKFYLERFKKNKK